MGNKIDQIQQLLNDSKATEIKVLDVRELTSITDTLIICTSRSTRHGRSVADKLVQFAKENDLYVRAQGQEHGEWVLIDLSDMVIHIMLPQIREFYQLEKLWEIPDLTFPNIS